MARDTAAIGTDVVIGSNTPDVETTVEALIRAYNRLPLDTNLTSGDRMEWNGTAWVPVGKDTSSSGIGALSGHYYGSPVSTVTTTAPGDGDLRVAPIDVKHDVTIDRIACEITAAAAGSAVRLGIYEDSNGGPGGLLLDAGTVAADTTGIKEITVAQALEAGKRYWIAACPQGGTPTFRAIQGTGIASGRDNSTMSVPFTGYRQVGVPGALPASWGIVSGGQSTTPRVLVRVQ